MRGTSRASLAAAKERLSVALAGATAAQASEVGDELFGVVGVLDDTPALRRALSDPARTATARMGLASGLFTGKVGTITLAQASGLAGDRWSGPGDLADAAEQLAVLAIAETADRQGQLDELEDELFRFGRIAAGNADLRSALSNQFVPAAGRVSLVTGLLAGKVSGAALRLISQVAAHPRGRSLDAGLQAYANLAAELRQRLVAEVRVATVLTDAQRARLAAALTATYGRAVHLNVLLDPGVLGGLSVRIGDELITGSVASRLAELRRDLAA